MERNDLGESLRSWRERLTPAAVGLPANTRRRTPGLRREELAGLAGVSPDYLTRLEQGRASNPSDEVVASLARALQLGSEEQAHLFRLAGRLPPGEGHIVSHVTPSVQRILDRLSDVPVMVIDAAWNVVAWNPMSAALTGDMSALRGRDRNVLWRHFTGAESRIDLGDEANARFEREGVADLHAAVGRYPDDAGLRALIDDLRGASDTFDRLWRERPAAERSASRKTIVHPDVGPVTVDCDVLRVQGSDLRLIVYSAAPGSPDARTLELLRVVGLQELSS
jgi:transcriptional regulator with XRE-family HTH domain